MSTSSVAVETDANLTRGGRRPRTSLLLALLAAALLLRIVAMVQLPLIPDEAYYWMYAQNPSLSYFDHPPVIAWVVMLGTAVLGDNEAGVRIIGALLMLAASVMMYLFARLWFSHMAALLAAVLLHVLPIYFGMGIIATPDSPMIFFWLLGLWGASIALRRQRAWGWYIAGLGLGLAMLTKYTGVFLAAGVVLAVVVHRPWRWHLRSPHPYLAVLLALLIFSPVLIWNAGHDWISFRFQFVDRFDEEPARWKNPVYFLGYQLAMATPVILAAGGWLVGQIGRRRVRLRPRWIIALALSLPLLAVVALKSLSDEVLFHWTAPVYLSLLPAACQIALVQARRVRRSPLLLGLHRTAVICLAVVIGGGVFLILGQPGHVLVPAFGPWPQLARAVHDEAQRVQEEIGYPPLVIARGRYALASSIAFYRHRIDPSVLVEDLTTGSRFLTDAYSGYSFWIDRADWIGRDCLYLSTRPDGERLLEYFHEITPLDHPRLEQADRRYHLYRGHRLR